MNIGITFLWSDFGFWFLRSSVSSAALWGFYLADSAPDDVCLILFSLLTVAATRASLRRTLLFTGALGFVSAEPAGNHTRI
jgi:hypothetical protein